MQGICYILVGRNYHDTMGVLHTKLFLGGYNPPWSERLPLVYYLPRMLYSNTPFQVTTRLRQTTQQRKTLVKGVMHVQENSTVLLYKNVCSIQRVICRVYVMLKGMSCLQYNILALEQRRN